MNKFFTGLLIGAVIAFHLGMNFGQGKPILSNPYADEVKSVQKRASKVIESTKETIHQATEPLKK